MLKLAAPLIKPGLFITGTDTGVGKTVVSCGILSSLRDQAAGQRLRLGPCKPFATGCREGRDGPIQEDVQALLRFSDTKATAATVCPQAFRQPAAPAAAAEAEGREVDWNAVGDALMKLDQSHDALLIEGVGGVLVPLDPKQPRYTVRDLIRAIGYPTLVVCRAELGTLNHTVLTVEALEREGCRVVGLVMNHTVADLREADDPTIATNAQWLERMTGVKVLCRIPHGRASAMQLEHGRMDPAVQHAISACHWGDLFAAADGK
ncbi:MAG: dethiobiotin synthase [Planctomycetota bacterium]